MLNQASKSVQLLNAKLEKEPLEPVVVAPPRTVEDLRAAAALGIRPTTDEAKLNQTEQAYLRWLRTMGDHWIGVQCITLKIGHDCRYTADFVALDGSGLRFIDTKGPKVWEDSLIKMRTAARMFPWIRFILATREGEVWTHKEVKP